MSAVPANAERALKQQDFGFLDPIRTSPQEYFYRTVMATAARAAGNDQAQSPNRETAAVPTTQPKRKPNRR
jgi:hypothetical protein